ncbi:uncharacterized protein LOC123876489 [Maniola jurtina]|uniref:uncharacterized protein LOC123876489 n=2 Tax=Maniola jurtina TaxID=191418 RepID=UPI001E68E7D2|nr:uncharacterized protein LOC123876489 [Maniola jurtina]
MMMTLIMSHHLTKPHMEKALAVSQLMLTFQSVWFPPQKKKRKGVINDKKKTAKKLRNSGKQYVSLSKTKRVISERRMGPPCTERCRLRCSEKIDEDHRNAIFKLYWEMGCITRQRDFICKHLTIVTPKYSYKRENNNRKPKHAFHLTLGENRVRVCKIFFKNTLGINDRPIRTVLEKMCDSGIVEPEKRGKHGNQHKVLDEVVQGIKNHIDSIPRIESHYLRQQTSREFIDGGKNLMDLYRDYKKMCEDEGKPAGEQHTYRKIFKQDYNISFFIPKKDMCEFCAAFENMDVLKKEENELKYLEHHTEKEFSRVEKNEDKLKVQENYIVACYDLQAVLPLPMCKTSAFYYKSKLNVCNFTICELNKDKCNCYVWSEVDSLRGANEIGSCVLEFIKEKAQAVNDPNLEIVFYSDNCCGQQKNQFMFSMYMYALANFRIKSITHKFLISGHTQNENDNVHSVIEKEVRKFLKSSPIYVPEQYITLIKSAKKRGNTYNVKGMLYSDFYDLKNLAYECGTHFNKNTHGDTVRLSDIKVIKFVKENHGEIRILYKNSFTENQFNEIALNRQSRSRRNANRLGFPLKQLNNTKLELTTRKKNDLKSLIDSNLIPRYYAELFYNGIL